MAFPVLIDPAYDYDIPYQADTITHFGPFGVSGTTRYAVLRKFYGGNVAVFKTTDGGNTWAIQDAVNGPISQSGASGERIIAACEDATNIYVAYLDAYCLMVRQFSKASDTWGATSDVGPTLYQWEGYQVSLARRASDLVAFFNVASGVAAYSVLSGGSWSAPVTVGGAGLWPMNVAVLGAEDRVHLFYRHIIESGGSYVGCVIYHRCLNGASVGAQQLLADYSAGEIYIGYKNLGLGCLNGSEVLVPYVGPAGSLIVGPGNVRVFRATSADAPTWTDELVSDGLVASAATGSGTNLCAAALGGNPLVFWNAPDGDTYGLRYRSNSGSGWGSTDISLESGYNPSQHVGVLPTDATHFGIMFENGAPYYDELTVSVATPRGAWYAY